MATVGVMVDVSEVPRSTSTRAEATRWATRWATYGPGFATCSVTSWAFGGGGEVVTGVGAVRTPSILVATALAAKILVATESSLKVSPLCLHGYPQLKKKNCGTSGVAKNGKDPQVATF